MDMEMTMRLDWLQRKRGLGGDGLRVVIVSTDFVIQMKHQIHVHVFIYFADQAIKVCGAR